MKCLPPERFGIPPVQADKDARGKQQKKIDSKYITVLFIPFI
jgi:hypothetical protein